MPWQGNESELRLAITQKNLVAFYRQEQTWIFSCRNQPDFHHFSGNCRGSTESSSRRIRNTLILGLVHRLAYNSDVVRQAPDQLAVFQGAGAGLNG